MDLDKCEPLLVSAVEYNTRHVAQQRPFVKKERAQAPVKLRF